jgi:hypothetical protein
MKALDYIMKRISEASTFRGLAVLGGLVGLSLSPQHWEAIGSAVAAVIALIEVFRKEKK